jgi:ADP-heptose:LPS heptosyltransferase
VDKSRRSREVGQGFFNHNDLTNRGRVKSPPPFLGEKVIYSQRKKHNDFKTILCTTGQGLGNLIQKTPAMKALREIYPNAKIDLLVNEKQLGILEGWDVIDNVMTDTNDSYDLVVNFTPPYWGKQHTGRLKTVDCNRERLKSEAEWKVNLDYVLSLNREVKPKDITPYFPHTEFQREKGEEIWIGLAHGCGTDWLERKDYGAERFAECVKMLIKNPKVRVFVFGHGERDRKIRDYIPQIDRVEDCIDWYDIKETSGIIKKCDCVFGNDTGLIHIASALNVPSVVFFGASSIKKNRPFRGCKIISKRLKCSETCQWEKGCEELDCLKIEPSVIVDEVLRIAEGKEDNYKFGIWMTTHNRFPFLASTLKSIVDADMENPNDYKFVFLDDLSTDERVMGLIEEVCEILSQRGCEVIFKRHDECYGKARYGDTVRECFNELMDCRYMLPIQDDFLLNKNIFRCAEKSIEYLKDNIKMVYLILHEAKSGCYVKIDNGIGNIGSYHEWWVAVWHPDLWKECEIINFPCAYGSGSGRKIGEMLHQNGWQCARLNESCGIHLGETISALNADIRGSERLEAINPNLFGIPEVLT